MRGFLQRPPWSICGVLIAATLVAGACTGSDGDVVAVEESTTVVESTAVGSTAVESTAVQDSSTTTTVAATTTTAPAPTTLIERPLSNPVTVLALSDLADCRGPDAEVAELVRSLGGTIVTPGDLAYDEGTQQQFEDCFLPLYGSELDRMYATPGDNDYKTPGAAPYFTTMSGGPGDIGKGWYAVEIGSWQLIALNSNCDEVGGCREDSEQYQWLDALLMEKQYDCRIVMWHHPRFTSSANYSGIPRLGDFYGRLHGAGADILIVGNSHHYERLGPLLPSGKPSAGGMMNFTVGVGGASFSEFGAVLPGSQARSNEHRGLVRFTLGDGGYDWEFVNVESNETDLVDAGSADC